MNIKPLDVDFEELSDYQKTKYHAHIQAWYSANFPKENMSYCESANISIQFLRDQPRYIFGDKLKSIEVISTHTSKSIKLPVVLITLIDGTQLIIRDNFHDYKLTVISENPLGLSMGLFNSPGEDVHSVYCEGFEDKWVLPKYDSKNNKQFTVELSSHYIMFTTLFLISEQL